MYLFYNYYVSFSQCGSEPEKWSKLVEAHGFKVSLTTDDYESTKIMEVYVPVLKAKADNKMKVNDKKNMKY